MATDTATSTFVLSEYQRTGLVPPGTLAEPAGESVAVVMILLLQFKNVFTIFDGSYRDL
jgi:hypothetical protein